MSEARRTNRRCGVAAGLLAALTLLSASTSSARTKVMQRWETLGEAALRARRVDQAIGYFASVVALQPGRADAEQRLALALDASVVQVPAGWFDMGSDDGDVDEGPRRDVYLDAFEIDKYEVTNGQYARFLRAKGREGPRRPAGRYLHLTFHHPPDWAGSRYPAGEAMYPAAGVGWEEAAEYCAWVGKRLPTEAEWEKAARGADGRNYPWGPVWDPGKANIGDRNLHYTIPVGSYPRGASPYGALDMAGNVWEWVSDLYDRQYYTYAPVRNPLGPPSGTGERMVRGGAWDSSPDQARTWYRNATHYFGPNFRVGFRCARSLG